MSRKLIKKEIGPIRHNHIYNVPESKVEDFVTDCLSLSFSRISVESLNCYQSCLRRKRDDISLKDCMKLVSESKHRFYSFILRKGFGIDEGKNYWEFCASGLVEKEEYFVWIEIQEESGYKLVEKYNLINNENA